MLKKKKKKKEGKAIRPMCVTERKTHLREEPKQECHSAIVRKTQVRALGGVVREEIERNTMVV